MTLNKQQFLLSLAQRNTWRISVSVVLGIFSSFFNGVSTALIVPIILNLLGDEGAVQDSPQALRVLMSPFEAVPSSYRLLVMSLAIVFAIVLKNGTAYMNTVLTGKIVRSLSSDVREEALKIVLSTDIYYFNNIPRGDTINRMSGEIDRSIQLISD